MTHDAELLALARGEHAHPHALLGPHPTDPQARGPWVVRAMHPHAVECQCIATAGRVVDLKPEPIGSIFSGRIENGSAPGAYRFRWRSAEGATWESEDPYRFPPTLGDLDLHLFNEGAHKRLWEHLGAHFRTIAGVDGYSFSVWAPNAMRVSVVGDFCDWDGRRYPMRQLGRSGVYELFIPGLQAGARYKYEIKTLSGDLRLKADPFAFSAERPPGTASLLASSDYIWNDGHWMSALPTYDPVHRPVAVYEVHLGSWRRLPEEGHRSLTYREIAPLLVSHVKRLGFTHIELLPIAEHPYDRSWGYQVTGYYAPTSRHGTPDDFRFFVDYCHQNGVGVILDWVPAHFPKDDHALRLFDGTALYEHDDPRRAEHPDWGTLIFNYDRREVRNFLLASALYWLDEYHIDGLRVDAVASMLYRDYSRKHGEWTPNIHGGREDLEAIDFLRHVTNVIREDYPGRMVIAEESTAWGGVTRPASEGGLGFTFKWNMGWMHDTLDYFSKDAIHRRYHQNDLTFAMLYEHTERFLMPLSHDEVVHGKGSLLSRMPGDEWQKFANLRLLLGYQFTRPGKKLIFMGTELAPWGEWNHEQSLDWHLQFGHPLRDGLQEYCCDLGKLYNVNSALWKWDHEPGGFTWIDCADADNSVIAYVRSSGTQFVLVVLNLTPVPRNGYRIGALVSGVYETGLCSDDPQYGGSGMHTPRNWTAEALPFHGFPQSLVLDLPPLSVLVLSPSTRK